MYNDSVDFVVKSIQKASLVNLNGLIYQEYENFFDSDLQSLLDFDYDKVRLEKFAMQHNKNRLSVSHDEMIIKKITLFFRNVKIKKTLEEKFNLKLGISSVDIWYDSASYLLDIHRDYHTIQLALQIYLGEDNNVGTCLFDEEKKIIKTFPYKKNSGYALLNNEKSFHGTEIKETGKSHLRKSLYVRWEQQ